jgi:hypothetical protein
VPEAPCRLFVYLARESPVAVVLRRGPTDWARLSLWHTDSDRFEHGQWLKGRVYERRSDLSADGSLFAAFVRQSGGRDARRDTWIAVSRPPFFSALAVWFVGGTYHTGAFFPGHATLWLGFSPDTPPDIGHVPSWLSIAPARDIAYIDRTGEWTERTVHFNRLIRDGWTLLETEPYRTLWARRHPSRPLALHMMHSFENLQVAGGRYVVDYSLWNETEGREQGIGQATWADWDQRGRLVVARQGKLLWWPLESGTLEEIADFNGHEPDPQPAPDAAGSWPAAPRDRIPGRDAR